MGAPASDEVTQRPRQTREMSAPWEEAAPRACRGAARDPRGEATAARDPWGEATATRDPRRGETSMVMEGSYHRSSASPDVHARLRRPSSEGILPSHLDRPLPSHLD